MTLLFLAVAPKDRDGDGQRARIMQLVRAHPGIHTAQIKERLDLAWSTVDYHLRVMERDGIIRVSKMGRENHIFPLDVEPTQHMWFAALRDEGAHRVFQRLIELPGQGVPMLSEWAGLSHKVIRRQLTDLVDVGLVTRRGRARPTFEPNLDVLRKLPPSLLKPDTDGNFRIDLN